MNSVTALEDDSYAFKEVPIHKQKGKTSFLETFMSSAQRRKLADISNLQDHANQMNTEETQKQNNMLFSSKEYAEKLQKENMTLMKTLAHRNKIIELSGVEYQKLRINLRSVQEKNLQLAQANNHMLAELNTSRDRLKLLQHELGCKNVLLKARQMQLEEQVLPATHHASKDKVHDMNHKDTKRNRTSTIKPSRSTNVKPTHVKENSNSKRKASEVIDTTDIPEETLQTEDNIEKGVVSRGENQIVDNIVNNKFLLDAENRVKGSVASKRQCVRRKSTRFGVQETEKLPEMDDAKEPKVTARLSLKRRSARLRPEEAEVIDTTGIQEETLQTEDNIEKGIVSREENQIVDNIVNNKLLLDAENPVKGSVVSKRQCVRRKSTRFDVQETEETKKLLEMDDTKETKETARLSLKRRSARLRPEEAELPKNFHEKDEIKETIKRRRVSSRQEQSATFDFQEPELTETVNANDIRSEAVEPSEIGHQTKDTNGKHRFVKNSELMVTSVSQESKNNKPKTDETEGMVRRRSVGRPSRHAAEKVQSYREVSLKAKMRRSR